MHGTFGQTYMQMATQRLGIERHFIAHIHYHQYQHTCMYGRRREYGLSIHTYHVPCVVCGASPSLHIHNNGRRHVGGGGNVRLDPVDVCMYVCMYDFIYLYMCMYVCMYECMYVCMYVCMHACIRKLLPVNSVARSWYQILVKQLPDSSMLAHSICKVIT